MTLFEYLSIFRWTICFTWQFIIHCQVSFYLSLFVTFYFSLFVTLSLFVIRREPWSSAGVLNLLVLAYPQIKIVPLCVPPNKNWTSLAYPLIKNSTHIVFFWVVFTILQTPCELLAYPLWSGCVPPGVRVPQVENRWSSF